ncbi:MAG: DinB family protein, partial [Rhodospirillales bacterium]|nr:DinB family protein [Rhodospirillales bacterium]
VEGAVALNPVAWIVGHVIVTLVPTIERLGGRVELPEDWAKRFEMGSKPHEDATALPSKTELLNRLAAVETELDRVLDVTPIEQWDDPMPGEFRKMTPTLGDEILFMGILHLAIHIGQMTSSRRCLNHEPRF